MSTRSTRDSKALGGSSNASKKNKLNQVSNVRSTSAPRPSKASERSAVLSKESKDIAEKNESAIISSNSISSIDVEEDSKVKLEDAKIPANVGKKRKRNPLPDSGEEEHHSNLRELPHNMGGVSAVKDASVAGEKKNKTKPSSKNGFTKKWPVKEENDKNPDNEKAVNEACKPDVKPKAYSKKMSTQGNATAAGLGKKVASPTKKDTYGLSEGVSPFPNYARPTPEECHKVAKLLQKAHPNCHPRPKTIPEPSQIVAGCGDVPSILDAMIRTLLSAATNGRNSSNAYQGMIKRYGSRKTGIGKGSVDYNAVRLAPQADLENAIASGGLAKNKSKNIKAILDMVYEENQQRRNEILNAKVAGNVETGPGGMMRQSDAQKNAEVQLADGDFLSLDHLHYLPTYAAISHLTKYPGIGVKTAACVALFCMQRDCFAVDTHVFRLCKWLAWVPDQAAPDYVKAKGEPRVDRDPTFSHLEVRIPDELKYNLHQLFIQHGKKCGRCRGNTSENHPDWVKGCPIEELVDRRGPRKVGNIVGKAGKVTDKSKKKRKLSDIDEDATEDEEDVQMSDLVEDEDDEEVEEAMSDLDDETEYSMPLKTARTPRSSRKGTRATRPPIPVPARTPAAKKASQKKQ